MQDKQPEVGKLLADALERGAFFPAYPPMPLREAATLLRTQHAAIERKDALLRQALTALKRSYGYGTTLVDDSTSDVIESITKELSQ